MELLRLIPAHTPLQTEIALAEAKADYTRFEIDLRNKPDWYVPKVNPVGKVRLAHPFARDHLC